MRGDIGDGSGGGGALLGEDEYGLALPYADDMFQVVKFITFDVEGTKG